MNSPFAHHTPSVFVVCSPFQVLCAVAAIRQLEIKDYKFILTCGNKDNRRQQVINLVDSFDINYEIESVSRLKIMAKRIAAFIPHKHGFKRLFIGDYRNNIELYYGSQYICDGADIVYLDDGTATVSMLNNTNGNWQKTREEKAIGRISKLRHLTLYKNLLTIYTDIPNPKYNIAELSLNSIFSQHNHLPEKDVVVVGTNATMYCKGKDLSEEKLIAIQRELMEQLVKEYPDERIVYIPHGKDKSEYAKLFCQECGCEFRRTELPIEMELIHQPYAPRAIYGFTSSALYNLKKIYPSTRVVNVLYASSNKKTQAYISYRKVSDYYEKNGIELVEINVEN